MDTWYAVCSLFQRIAQSGKYFYCPIKRNRLVKEHPHATYCALGELAWNQQESDNGKLLKVNDLGLTVGLFPATVSTDRTDYVLTNDLNPNKHSCSTPNKSPLPLLRASRSALSPLL